MTRIRYTDENGVLTSKPMLAGTELVLVEIDTNANRYRVLNRANSNVLSEGEAFSVALLKKRAKSALRSLGVVFDDEVRNRTTSTK